MRAYLTAVGFRTIYARLKESANEPIALIPLGVVVGRVLDAATGQPVRDFNVKLVAATGKDTGLPSSEVSPHLERVGESFESATGDFRIGDLTGEAPLAVVVSAQGYAPARLEPVESKPADWGKWPVVIRLGQGSALAGSVVDAASGRGVAGAEVTLTQSPGQRSPNLRGVKTLSGPDGRFEFRRVADWCQRSLAVRAQGYAATRLEPPAGGQPAVIRLARGGTLVGTARGYPGLALDRARVRVDSGGVSLGEQAVDAEGAFRIDGVPAGKARVLLTDGWAWRRIMHLDIQAGETARLDFAKLPGFTLSGKVLRGGEPLVGTEVSVHGMDSPIGGTVQTGDDGRYVVPSLPAGMYIVEASLYLKGNSYPVRAWTRVTLMDGDAAADLSFFCARIRGRLTDAAGQDLAAAVARIAAYRLLEPDAPPRSMFTLALGQEPSRPDWVLTSAELTPRAGLRVTDFLGPRHEEQPCRSCPTADGGFELWCSSPGLHTIVLYGEPGFPRLLGEARIERDGQTVEVALRDDPSASLRLRAVDADTGRPVAGARIILCSSGGKVLASFRWVSKASAATADDEKVQEEFRTGAEGRFALNGLQPADYGVWAIAPGYGPRFVAPVPAAEKPAETLVRLERAGTLVLRAAPDMLKGLAFPCLAYRIRLRNEKAPADAAAKGEDVGDAAGRAVFPGGEGGPSPPERGSGPPLDTGVFKLFGGGPPERRVDVLPPGRYTLEWQIHPYPRLTDPKAPYLVPAAARGRADVEIRKGGEAVLPLVPAP